MPKVRKAKSTATTDALPYSFVRSETQLFSEAPYDVSLASTSFSEYHPINSISDANAPVQFCIQSNDVQFVDVNNIKLFLVAQIVKEDGTASADTDIVIPANNFLHSCSSNVQFT